MQPISPVLRLVLGAIAAGFATLMAPDVFGILPTWLQVVIGFVSAVVAFLLLPVNWMPNQEKTRAFKRGAPRRAKDAADRPLARAGTDRSPRRTSFAVAMLAALIGLVITAAPASAAVPPLTRTEMVNACANMEMYAVAWSQQNIGPGGGVVFTAGGFQEARGTNGAMIDCVYIGNWGGVCYDNMYQWRPAWADHCLSQQEVRMWALRDPSASRGMTVAFVSDSPQWKYLGWKMSEYAPEYQGVCPNYGGYCIHGDFPYGF